MTTPPRLILASRSPRRSQLLARAGYRFEVVSPQKAEPSVADRALPPELLAASLAYYKARDVADRAGCGRIVLGADTLVALDDVIYGKAADEAEARQILRTLSHHRHQVITGVAVIDADAGRRFIDFDVTHVTMKPMTDAEIEEYVAGGAWRDKAGAYAIQEGADRFILKLEGSESNVVGLPLGLVADLLAKVGLRPDRPVTPGENEYPE